MWFIATIICTSLGVSGVATLRFYNNTKNDIHIEAYNLNGAHANKILEFAAPESEYFHSEIF